MEAISDYNMDVKPSLKHTPSKPALGVLRLCYREAFSLFSQVRFELTKFTTISAVRKPERIKSGDYRDFSIVIIMRMKSIIKGCLEKE